MRSHILVVDDDDDARDGLVEALTGPDVEVHGAANGQEALEMIRTGGLHPDLIVLDLMMPVMGGVSFLQHRAIDPKIGTVPVVVLTGEGSLADELEGSVVAYLPKPTSLERLREIIAATLPSDGSEPRPIPRPARLAVGTEPPPYTGRHRR